jgi:DNA-binding response OmpR family regulator
MPTELRIVLAVADAAERAALAERLAEAGFEVMVPPGTPNLGDALADAAAMVLDARLARPDAPALCAALRREGHVLPILVLHDGTEGLVVRCLDAGANDAIARPLRTLELVARVRAQLRHHGAGAGAALTVGPYLFRPDQRELEEPCSGRVIRLTATEAAMLRFLQKAGGSVVSRQVLLHEVWGYREGVTTHTVETHIYRLRRKIEPDPRHRRLLLCEDSGYRLDVSTWAPVAQDLSAPAFRASA